MIISFTNVIGAIQSLVKRVITDNLKMWLGFETSETLGREEVTNGDFATDSDWNKNSNWSISGGVAIADGTTNGDINQGTTLATIGNSYSITYEVVSISQGSFYFKFGGVSGAFRDEIGIYTEVIQAINTNRIALDSLNNAIGSVTNISVKELTQITPDKSGNNNVGELFTGKALELDGINDDIRFGSIQIPVKTISCWIKPLSVSNEGLFFLGLSGFPQFRQITITNGNISATSYLTNFTSYVNNVQTSAVTQDVWQRVVLTFDEWTTTSIQIGNVYSSVYGHCAISDVQFYNETWSADDIAYDYANPQNLVTDRSGTSIALSNLKGYWHLSEGDGLVAYDSSGEGNNGTINGATYDVAQPRIPQLGMMDWSKGSNLFSYSQDFSQWNKEATVTLTPNYGTSPSGVNDSTRMQMNANDSLYLDNAGSSKTFSIYVKGTQGETIRLSNGVAQIFTLTGDWDRIQLYDTSASSTLYSINTYSGATARDMEIWGGQLESSSSASAYRLTDGAVTSNSTVISNPNNTSQDIFGNAVRDRLNSFNLDGSGYAEVADADSLNMSSGFSTSFWVKLDEGSTTTDYDFLVCKGRGVGGTNTAYGFGTTYYNNTIIATINTSVSKYQAISPSQTSTGQWVFVCVTYEPNTVLGLKLYLDDNSPNSITVSGTVDESHNLNVGGDSSFVTTRQSRNIISDVLFYDSVLTSDEVENNYNAGSSAHRN